MRNIQTHPSTTEQGLTMSIDIRSYSEIDIIELMEGLGEPKFRGKQLYEWLHTHNAASYDDMTNLPKKLRETLEQQYPLHSLHVSEKLVSQDGTRKYLLTLEDGCIVEAVGILDRDPIKVNDNAQSSPNDHEDNGEQAGRLTVCVSSQVGCAMECTFCATGQQGFSRNVTTDEIIQEVVCVGDDFDARVSNVVFMGQGEPFQNYNNVIEAMRRMNTDKGLNIGARHITVSTAGIVDGIYKFAEIPEQFRLAISLHSADQDTRNTLMPRLSGQPLRKLKKALEYYTAVKDRRITLEYMLLDGINDSDEQLQFLMDFCSNIKCHVNLLRFNHVQDSPYRASNTATYHTWIRELSDSYISASIRKSKGADISGACGQLANK